MNKEEFVGWCSRAGYSTINDWNHQVIGNCYYYFIKNFDTILFALIKEQPLTGEFEVLVEGWTDFNGMSE